MYYYVTTPYGRGSDYFNGYQFVTYQICDGRIYNLPSIPSGTIYTLPTAEYDMYYNNYVVLAPKNPIRSIRDYLKCFRNEAGSYYRVYVNIDQPTDGTYNTLNALTEHKVGHASITLQQINPALNLNITRSFGFYPGTNGTMSSPEGSPAFNDDSQYSANWDVQVSFVIRGDEMMSLVNFYSSYDSQNYHLKTRNCGSMVVESLGSIGISLPTEWQNSHWASIPKYYMGPNGVPSSAGWEAIYGPSIGRFGEQMKIFTHPRVEYRSTGNNILKPRNNSFCD